MARDFESFIVDPSLLDPSIDATDLRTTTDTRQELLSDVPDYQGIQYDPTQRSYISDLYALYSGQLPSRPATPSAPPSSPPSGGGDGGGSQNQGGGGEEPPNTGIGPQFGDPDYADPGVDAEENQPYFEAIDTGGITSDPIEMENISSNPYNIPMDVDDPGASIENLIAQNPSGTIPGRPDIFDINQTGDPSQNPGSTNVKDQSMAAGPFDYLQPISTIANPEIFDSYAGVDDPQIGDPGFTGYKPSFETQEQESTIQNILGKAGQTVEGALTELGKIPGAIVDFTNKTVDVFGNKLDVGKTIAGAVLNKIAGGPVSLLLSALPEPDPRQRKLNEFYSTGEGAKYMDPSSPNYIPGMENYHTVSGGFLNTITGGKYGTPTNYGLQGSYQKRIDTVENTLQDKYGLTDKDIADIKAGTFDPEKMNVQTDLVQRLVDLGDAKKAEADMLGLTAAEEKRLKELDFKDYFAGNKDQDSVDKDQDSVDKFDTTPQEPDNIEDFLNVPDLDFENQYEDEDRFTGDTTDTTVTGVTRPGTGTVLGKEGIDKFDDAEADMSNTGTAIDAFNEANRQKHFDNTQKLKNAVAEGKISEETYNRLSAFDATKTMGLDPITGTLSSIGYQGVQTAVGDQGVGDFVGDTARNIQGVSGNLTPEEQVQYQEIISGQDIYRDPILGMVEEDKKTLADEDITNIDDYITNEDLFGGFEEKEDSYRDPIMDMIQDGDIDDRPGSGDDPIGPGGRMDILDIEGEDDPDNEGMTREEIDAEAAQKAAAEKARKERELQQKIRDAENKEAERVAAEEKAAAEKARKEKEMQQKIRDAENQERERVAAAEKAAAEKAAKEREMQQQIRDAERAAEEKAARDKATRERDLGGGPQFGDKDKATREKDLGSGPPGIGGGGGDGGGGGCFLADTLITMADGSTKEVQKVDLGDNVAEGGKVFATGKFLVENLHDYKGIKVSGSHMVNEDDNWVRVKDSKHGKPLGDDEHTVYVFGSENRRILINGILFTDYFETTEQEKLINDEKNFFNNWKTYENKIDQDNINILNAS